MKLLKKIALILLCGAALSAAPSYAVITEGWVLTNPYHEDADNIVLGLSDIHNIFHASTEYQLESIKALIKNYNPKDVCVIAEAVELLEECFLPARFEQAIIHDTHMNMLNRIAAYCAENNIEVHSVDFRKVWTDSLKNEVVSISQEPERAPNLLSIIKEQIAKVNAINPTIINKGDRMLFNHTLKQGEIPPHKMLQPFIRNLIDARIIAHICATDKKIVIVIAGLDHMVKVRKQLQQHMRYELVAQTAATDVETSRKLAAMAMKHPELADQLIKSLDIKKFVEKINAIKGSVCEPSESKTNENDADTDESTNSASAMKSKKRQRKK